MTAPVAEATTPTLNLPLAEAVLEQVLAHPETHDQDCFGIQQACKTTHCIAGWAAVLSPEAEVVWASSPFAQGVAVLNHVEISGHALDASEAGLRLLGLNEDEADALFFNFDDDQAVGYLRELIAAAKRVTS